VAHVSIRLPSVLRQLDSTYPCEVEVEGETARDALRALTTRHPTLGRHLFDERDALREHVLCVHNGRQLRESSLDAATLGEGDELAIMQAVSGG